MSSSRARNTVAGSFSRKAAFVSPHSFVDLDHEEFCIDLSDSKAASATLEMAACPLR